MMHFTEDVILDAIIYVMIGLGIAVAAIVCIIVMSVFATMRNWQPEPFEEPIGPAAEVGPTIAVADVVEHTSMSSNEDAEETDSLADHDAYHVIALECQSPP